jgi:hypothetical protein
VTTSGYTEAYNAGNTGNITLGVFYKRMGPTPDTNVVCKGSGNADDAIVYACYVLRNVDNSVLDTAVTVATGSSTNPNSPSITTLTNKAMVMSLAISKVSDNAVTPPTGYANQVFTRDTQVNPATLSGATIIKTLYGVEDPPAWSNWASGDWRAVTVAIRAKIG